MVVDRTGSYAGALFAASALLLLAALLLRMLPRFSDDRA